MARILLYDEIAAVLKGWMTTREIAVRINERNIYVRRNGQTLRECPKTSSEISARVNKCSGMFERDRSQWPHRVRLRRRSICETLN